MSLSATCVAYDTKIKDPLAKLVLIEMSDWADESGRGVFSLAHAVNFTQATEEEVLDAVNKLVAHGCITVGPSDKQGRPTICIVGAAQ